MKTVLGRTRYVPGIGSQNANTRRAAERDAVNTPVQGSAADIMKLAMIQIWKWLRQDDYPARLLLQVHDEALLESAPKAVEEVKKNVTRIMESCFELLVPLTVKISTGHNWYEVG